MLIAFICFVSPRLQMQGLVALALAVELAAAAVAPMGGVFIPGSSRELAGPGRVSSSLRLRGGGKDKMHWCVCLLFRLISPTCTSILIALRAYHTTI